MFAEFINKISQKNAVFPHLQYNNNLHPVHVCTALRGYYVDECMALSFQSHLVECEKGLVWQC